MRAIAGTTRVRVRPQTRPDGLPGLVELVRIAGGDPVNGRDPRGECLVLDKVRQPCSYYDKLPELISDAFGHNSLAEPEMRTSIRRSATSPSALFGSEHGDSR